MVERLRRARVVFLRGLEKGNRSRDVSGSPVKNERDWWREGGIKVAGEGGTPGVGPVHKIQSKESKREFFSSFVGKWGRFRNVSGWLGIDEWEWRREGAVGVAGEGGKPELGPIAQMVERKVTKSGEFFCVR